MKKILSLVMLIFTVAYIGTMDQVKAQGTPLGHFIDVYDGNTTAQYAVCAGAGEDCIGGDVKKYPKPPGAILV
jgi:hypothetical protein